VPAQGPRPPRLCYLIACALGWIGAAAGQDASPPEPPHVPWSPPAEGEPPLAEPAAEPRELPLPDAAAPTLEIAESGQPEADEADSPESDFGASDLAEPDFPASDLAESDLPGFDFAEPAVTGALVETEAGVAAPDPDAGAFGVGNDDVLEMTRAQFSETTILAAIAANPTRFDVAPRALVALKNSGVSEAVIEAMLAAETAKKQTAAPARETELAAPKPSEEFTKLSAMIERLAAQQEAAEAARRPPDPPKSSDSSPRAWTVTAAEKTALAPTIAQVAFTDEKGGNRLKTLQSLAGKALAFTNPAVSGIATTLGGLFRSDNEQRTAVWALAGTSAARGLAPVTAFEIGFGHTPGVDPDAYQPAIVRLVRTNDNYRLVAAAKTEGSKTIATPKDPIVEELVPTQLTRITRGHYRVQAKETLGPGEYALVLRPIVQKERRRRISEASLGELLGGGTSQILYLTWDFSVATE
jgi:hypothetical protein